MIRKLLRRSNNLDRLRGLVERLIDRLVPRLPVWLLPTLAGITVAVLLAIVWRAFA